MKPRFQVHDPDTVPDASRPTLEMVQGKYGFVPNLLGVLAESPAAIEAYVTLGNIFSGTGLSPTEQHVVLQTHNQTNGCHYCQAAHSTIAKGGGVEAAIDAALRENRPIDEPRLEALRQFTQAVIRERGWVDVDTIESFLGAGYTRGQVLDVVLGVAFKTLSNYTNHIAQTPLDPAFEDNAIQDTG